MKLIAKVTLVTKTGEVAPGAEIDIKDKAEAESLIARGFAALPVPKAAAEPDAAADGTDQGAAQ